MRRRGVSKDQQKQFLLYCEKVNIQLFISTGIQIRIQDSQMNADLCGSGSTTLGTNTLV
jgi:hypothetical protein